MAPPRYFLAAVVMLFGLASAPDLAVRASPVYGKGPSDVRISVRVARNVDNRLLRVTLDSGAYYRSSEITLSGAGASEHHMLSWRAVPVGRYLVIVSVHGARGVRREASATIELLGGF